MNSREVFLTETDPRTDDPAFREVPFGQEEYKTQQGKGTLTYVGESFRQYMLLLLPANILVVVAIISSCYVFLTIAALGPCFLLMLGTLKAINHDWETWMTDSRDRRWGVCGVFFFSIAFTLFLIFAYSSVNGIERWQKYGDCSL